MIETTVRVSPNHWTAEDQRRYDAACVRWETGRRYTPVYNVSARTTDLRTRKRITDLVPSSDRRGRRRGQTTKTIDDFREQLRKSGGYLSTPLSLRRVRVQLTKTPGRYRIMIYRNNYQYAWPNTFTYDEVYDLRGEKTGPCLECLAVANEVITGGQLYE